MNPLARDARAIFDAAVAGVRPEALLADLDLGALAPQPLSTYDRIVLVGAGKAGLGMARAIEAMLEAHTGRGVDEGLMVVPHGYRATADSLPRSVEVVEAGHPVPDAAGVEAARRTLALARRLGPDDLLLVALSGGGSALWPAFADGISLEDTRQTSRLLLHSGADIEAVNTVRRALSRIGGGGLARTAAPADILALVISDVVGDDLATIASGPTGPNPTTRADARAVLGRFGLTDRLPPSVRRALRRPDPPASDALGRVRTLLVGSNRDALDAARAEAERRGYAVRLHPAPVTGEAREVGRRLITEVLTLPLREPTCLLWGGETTVTVRGDGRGGRNQEVALAAALALEGAEREVVLLSGGTDGVDGPTDAAGAWASPHTASRARALGLDPAEHLARNNSHPFFDTLGMLVRTGPTHTNVGDVQIAVLGPS